MTDTTSDHRQAVALFRYGLIADLLHLPPGGAGLQQRWRKKPHGSTPSRAAHASGVAAETIRDWLKRYRKGGFEALLPKPRADRGRARGLPAAVADQLLSIKEANPKLSVRLVIQQARASAQVDPALPLPPATVHRLLTRHGLMAPRAEDPGTRDRRRFAFERAGQLWTSDVMHGPSVRIADHSKRKTYLIAFLDDATRVVPYAAFALSEKYPGVFAGVETGLIAPRL